LYPKQNYFYIKGPVLLTKSTAVMTDLSPEPREYGGDFITGVEPLQECSREIGDGDFYGGRMGND